MKTNNEIRKVVESMSLDELCGQVLNIDLASPDFEISEYDGIFKEMHLGSVYTAPVSPLCKGMNQLEMNRTLCKRAGEYAPIPTMVLTDGWIENFDQQITKMAWGATDDPELMEEYARVYAQMLRKTGNHVLLGPVVDINYNFNNPLVNTRAMSDSADHVIKMAGAFVRGLTSENRVVACCKHFPGDGMDDRNQHYCTTVNSKGRQEWLETYGRVYKEMFKNGAKAVMCAHISLPSWQSEEEIDRITGYLPCSLSKNLMTDLLKRKLGFDGCIISDAMNMVGAVAVCKREELGVRFINAGGDLMLFSKPEDYRAIRKATEDGVIPTERLRDAAERVLRLKNSVGLLDDEQSDDAKISLSGDPQDYIDKAVAKSFRIERNFDKLIPLKLNRGDRILLLNLISTSSNNNDANIDEPLRKELEDRGFKVDQKNIPFIHTELKGIEENYDCVLVNSFIDVSHSNAGSLRCGSDHMGPFWDGLGLSHPKFIFTSFGDPYKLYEFPFLHTYINAFSCGEKTQKYFVKVLLGEEKALGKNPVELKGFFEREV